MTPNRSDDPDTTGRPSKRVLWRGCLTGALVGMAMNGVLDLLVLIDIGRGNEFGAATLSLAWAQSVLGMPLGIPLLWVLSSIIGYDESIAVNLVAVHAAVVTNFCLLALGWHTFRAWRGDYNSKPS